VPWPQAMMLGAGDGDSHSLFRGALLYIDPWMTRSSASPMRLCSMAVCRRSVSWIECSVRVSSTTRLTAGSTRSTRLVHAVHYTACTVCPPHANTRSALACPACRACLRRAASARRRATGGGEEARRRWRRRQAGCGILTAGAWWGSSAAHWV